MSHEPRWMVDLDVATFRASEGADRAAAWAAFLIARLPPGVRARAATAYRRGQRPSEIAELAAIQIIEPTGRKRP